jgi:hypothetical protein
VRLLRLSGRWPVGIEEGESKVMMRRIWMGGLAACLLLMPAMAQRAPRAERVQAQMAGKVVKGKFTDSARAAARAFAQARGKGGLRQAAATDRGALPSAMAPGVVQINLFDSGREAYFVLTETLPKGSQVQFFILPPDQDQEWAMEALVADEDLQPGFSFFLPGIKTLGDFWQSGLTTYLVIVDTPDGKQSFSATDFAAKGYFRDIVDVDYMVPGIYWWQQSWINSALWLEIKGRFIADTKTYVVLEDIVVPPSAIVQNAGNTQSIYVNLSNVPNFDLDLMKGYLLTVGQQGWTDTVQYRFTPMRP